MIDAAGVRGLVDYRISGVDCKAHKPAPEIYERALKGLGVVKERAFAVEDSSAGIVGRAECGASGVCPAAEAWGADRPEQGFWGD